MLGAVIIAVVCKLPTAGNSNRQQWLMKRSNEFISYINKLTRGQVIFIRLDSERRGPARACRKLLWIVFP